MLSDLSLQKRRKMRKKAVNVHNYCLLALQLKRLKATILKFDLWAKYLPNNEAEREKEP